MALKFFGRIHHAKDSDKLTKLQNCIDSKKVFAVGYADLDKFKVYNDKYGFEKGDEVIRELARILIANVRTKEKDTAFVGHIGGDDFVFITENVTMNKTCEKIVKEFDSKIPTFYTKEDHKAGYITGKDRQGKKQKFGLLSVSIGIVSNVGQEITHVAQISEIGAELKKYAKSFDKSNFVRDKRQG